MPKQVVTPVQEPQPSMAAAAAVAAQTEQLRRALHLVVKLEEALQALHVNQVCSFKCLIKQRPQLQT